MLSKPFFWLFHSGEWKSSCGNSMLYTVWCSRLIHGCWLNSSWLNGCVEAYLLAWELQTVTVQVWTVSGLRKSFLRGKVWGPPFGYSSIYKQRKLHLFNDWNGLLNYVGPHSSLRIAGLLIFPVRTVSSTWSVLKIGSASCRERV